MPSGMEAIRQALYVSLVPNLTWVRRPSASNTCQARGVGRGCSTRPEVSVPMRSSQSCTSTTRKSISQLLGEWLQRCVEAACKHDRHVAVPTPIWSLHTPARWPRSA